MVVKEAPYEKRNLGVAAVIFTVVPTDTAADILPAVSACDAEYQELHIPAGNFAALCTAQQAGFQFIETAIRLQLDLKDLALPRVLQRFEPYLSAVEADECTFAQILQRVEQGDMFLTDKIALNPRFGKAASGRRYRYWLQDARAQGASCLLVRYKGESIGFGAGQRIAPTVMDAFLAGIFPEFSRTGLGFAAAYSTLRVWQGEGITRSVASVSSNNVPVLKVNEMLGYKVSGLEYIYIRDRHTVPSP